jgi:hypothetical protein
MARPPLEWSLLGLSGGNLPAAELGIALRVGGSWIAAVGMLMLGWLLHGAS